MSNIESGPKMKVLTMEDLRVKIIAPILKEIAGIKRKPKDPLEESALSEAVNYIYSELLKQMIDERESVPELLKKMEERRGGGEFDIKKIITKNNTRKLSHAIKLDHTVKDAYKIGYKTIAFECNVAQTKKVIKDLIEKSNPYYLASRWGLSQLAIKLFKFGDKQEPIPNYTDPEFANEKLHSNTDNINNEKGEKWWQK